MAGVSLSSGIPKTLMARRVSLIAWVWSGVNEMRLGRWGRSESDNILVYYRITWVSCQLGVEVAVCVCPSALEKCG